MNWLAIAMVAASAALQAQDVPQVPAGTSLVFFDWGKAEISRDSAAVLDNVLAEFRRAPPTTVRVELRGHSDRSGPEWANRRASRRRAEAVRDWLVERGIPRRSIDVLADGESRMIVPTEDGVREAQNRRVEIRLIPEM
jgi:outer membrane protein OmpA-like peptidoglycan-associated protein